MNRKTINRNEEDLTAEEAEKFNLGLEEIKSSLQSMEDAHTQEDSNTKQEGGAQ